MKKEAKHTPGPILNDGETPKGLMLLAGPEDRETVIYLQGPERQQYARLFAAAPELLEAAKSARDVLAAAIKAAWEGYTDADVAENIFIKKLDAAIARATGGEG